MLKRRGSRLTLIIYLFILGSCVIYAAYAARYVIRHLESARDHFAAAEYHHQIYAIGGRRRDRYLDEIMKIDPGTRRTEVIGYLPSARIDLAAVEMGGKIYAIGGYDGHNYTDEIL
jgi:hypothetical protein